MVALAFDVLHVRTACQRHFYSAADEGIYTQIAYNTWHGKFLHTTIAPETHSAEGMSFLGVHFAPLLVLVSLPYLIFPSTMTVSYGSIVVALSSLLPCFLLASRRLRSPWAAFVVTLALGLNFNFLFNAVWIRIPIFAIPFLLWALYFWSTKRYVLFHVFLALYVLAEETLAPVAAMLGLVIALKGDKKHGLVWLLAGVVWFFLCTKIWMPFFNDHQYNQLAKVFPPDQSLWTVFQRYSSREHWFKFLTFSLPFLLLPLLAWETWLLIFPLLSLVFLVTSLNLFDNLYSRYLTPCLPLMIFGMILMLERIRKDNLRKALVIALLAASVLQHFGSGALRDFQIYRNFRHRAFLNAEQPRPELMTLRNDILSKLPPSAKVVATDRLIHFVSERPWVGYFPRYWEQADYILLDLRRVPWPFTNQAEYKAAINNVVNSKNFHLQASEASYLLFAR